MSKGINWRGIDWNQRNVDIARSLDVSQCTVSIQRRKYGPGSTPVISNTEKQFKLSTLRVLKINPLVNVGREKLLLASLKSRKGEEIVSVEKGEFCRAMNERTEILWSSNNNES